MYSTTPKTLKLNATKSTQAFTSFICTILLLLLLLTTLHLGFTLRAQPTYGLSHGVSPNPETAPKANLSQDATPLQTSVISHASYRFGGGRFGGGRSGDTNLEHRKADSQPIAEINGQPLTAGWFRTAVRADAAMDALISGRGAASGSTDYSAASRPAANRLADHEATLARVVNGELVRQVAAEARFVLAPTAIQSQLDQLLSRVGVTPAAFDVLLSAHQLTDAEFTQYFSHLVLVERFLQTESAARALSMDAIVDTLRKDARVSFSAQIETVLIEVTKPTGLTPNQTDLTPNKIVLPFDLPFPTIPQLTDGHSSAPSIHPSSSRSGDSPPIILSFWTTWCPYCRQQAPLLVRTYDMLQKHQPEDSLAPQIIGINVQEAAEKVQLYVDANNIPYPILLDAQGDAAEYYDIHGYPTTLFLDTDGQVVARHVGALTSEKLAYYLDQLTLETE